MGSLTRCVGVEDRYSVLDHLIERAVKCRT
jgi:hypothetical protein